MTLLKVSQDDNGKRLDVFLTSKIKKTSRSYVKFLIDNGFVRVNDSLEKPSFLISLGDSISYKKPKVKKILKTKTLIPKIYEDQFCIVYDKPADIVIHPSESLKPRKDVTLVDVIVRDYPGVLKIDPDRPGIVHRLDKNTSGVILVAKTKEALRFFQQQFKKREVNKVYEALVWGEVLDKEAVIDAPLARNSKSGDKFCISPEGRGREAITEYKVISYFKQGHDRFTLLEVRPKTGRTHQIRVHLASLCHPVVGDSLYSSNKEKLGLSRHFLHAKMLELVLPSKKIVKFKSKLPKELAIVIKNLEKI